MRATLFADAHIHNTATARLVQRFLDEKGDVYFLGDMFDSPEDAKRYDGFLSRYDFAWVKGNHDYWMELPDRIELGDFILTHGHKLLQTWSVERYLVKYTPAARRLGLFGPAMSFGRFFRDSPVEQGFGKIVLKISTLRRRFDRPVIMGHLHHYLVEKNIVVLPRFPKYAVLRGSRLEIRNYLDEI